MLVVSSEVLVCNIVERFHLVYGMVVWIGSSFPGGSCTHVDILGQFFIPVVSHGVLKSWRTKEIIIPPVILVGMARQSSHKNVESDERANLGPRDISSPVVHFSFFSLN